MFEIWWRDRLIDVVPAVAGEVPHGLTVRSRAAGRIERVRGEPRDWRFIKVLAMSLLSFVACVMVMTLTPVGEGGVDDSFFRKAMVTAFVPRPPPVKKLPARFSEATVKQLFAAGPSHGPRKPNLAAVLGLFDDAVGRLAVPGTGSFNALLEELRPGAGEPAGGPLGRGPRGGGGPGVGAGLNFVGRLSGTRPGPGGSELKGKGAEGPVSGTVHVTDGLSRDLVARVIRAHATEIKYCYERELQHSPGLAGKVSVTFTIGGAGEVIEAAVAESTLDNPSVEQCMLDRVKRWRFPEPSGGGTVEVNHPWIFRGAGDNDP